MRRIFHIVAPSDWAAACERGEYVPSAFAGDGFVHFSFAAQVARTANAFYRDVPELIVIEVDPARVDAPVRVEDSYGAGEEFPHVYGPIAIDAAVATHPLIRADNGDWLFSVDADDPASTDR